MHAVSISMASKILQRTLRLFSARSAFQDFDQGQEKARNHSSVRNAVQKLVRLISALDNPRVLRDLYTAPSSTQRSEFAPKNGVDNSRLSA
jgi:hypothetical protein